MNSKIIANIAFSLCEINNWTMERLDIQKYEYDSFVGYSAQLITNEGIYLIGQDGTVERSK